MGAQPGPWRTIVGYCTHHIIVAFINDVQTSKLWFNDHQDVIKPYIVICYYFGSSKLFATYFWPNISSKWSTYYVVLGNLQCLRTMWIIPHNTKSLLWFKKCVWSIWVAVFEGRHFKSPLCVMTIMKWSLTQHVKCVATPFECLKLTDVKASSVKKWSTWIPPKNTLFFEILHDKWTTKWGTNM